MRTVKHYQVAGQSVLPYDDQSRASYHMIGTGEVMPASWYRQIDRPEEVINVAGVLENMEINENLTVLTPDAHIEDDLNDHLMDVSVNSSTVPQDDVGLSLKDLLAKLKFFENLLATKAQDIPDDMKRCITKFTNTLDKLSASNNTETVKKSMFTF